MNILISEERMTTFICFMIIFPKYGVGKVLKTLKKNMSRSLSRKFLFLKKKYWSRKVIWEKGYFVSTVGINEAMLQKYVKSK